MSDDIAVMIDRYRSGECYAFAVAASRALGSRIGCVVVDLAASYDRTCGQHVVHAYCVRDDDTIFDAGGTIDDAHIEDFYLSGSRGSRFTAQARKVCDDADAFLELLRGTADSTNRRHELEEWLSVRFGEQVERARSDLPALMHLLEVDPGAPAP